MNNRDLHKSFDAGKTAIEKDNMGNIIVIAMILLDAVTICIPLLKTINELWILDIIMTVGACVVVDGGADLLGVLVFKDISMKTKAICFSLMLAFMGLVFYRLGCFRIETVDTLVGGNLGLIKKDTVPGIETLGHFMAELPVASSVFLFIRRVVSYDPNKQNHDLMELFAKSYKRTTALNKAIVMYGSREEREDNLVKYINAEKEAIASDIDTARISNDLDYNRCVAEHIKADTLQITNIMEEE